MHTKKVAALFLSFSSLVYSEPVEYGRHDGGEYCYYNPGCADGKIYPAPEQKRSISDTYYEESPEDVYRDSQSHQVDFAQIREMFPVFKQTVNGHPIIYLDSASTAQMPQVVLDEIVAYYYSYKSNVGRGIYQFAEQATQRFEETRGKVASFIGAKKHEIVFTSGTTAGINLVAQAWAQHNIKAGQEIIISDLEHNANLLPWQQLALRQGVVLKILPVGESGVIDLQLLEEYVTGKTKLIAVSQQSNMLGTTNDIAGIVKIAQKVGARVSVDAAQSIAHHKIDVAALGCDFLSFGAHKVYGPTGVGALFIKEDRFDELVLQQFGGGMVYEVGVESSEFKAMPHCMEAGTQAIAQVIGLGAAIDFVQKHLDFKQAEGYKTELVADFASQLQGLPGVTILTPIPAPGEHNNMVTFASDDYHAYDVATYLNESGIAVRAGYHCVHLYHDKLGGRATVRVSFSVYNTKQEVDFVINRLKELFEQD